MNLETSSLAWLLKLLWMWTLFLCNLPSVLFSSNSVLQTGHVSCRLYFFLVLSLNRGCYFPLNDFSWDSSLFYTNPSKSTSSCFFQRALPSLLGSCLFVLRIWGGCMGQEESNKDRFYSTQDKGLQRSSWSHTSPTFLLPSSQPLHPSPLSLQQQTPQIPHFVSWEVTSTSWYLGAGW